MSTNDGNGGSFSITSSNPVSGERQVNFNGSQVGSIDANGKYSGLTIDQYGVLIPVPPGILVPVPLGSIIKDFLRWITGELPTPQPEPPPGLTPGGIRAFQEFLDFLVPSAYAGERRPSGGSDSPWEKAKKWLPPRDPIILDLDGDGLETVGLAANIHFDHDGDGVLTRTGWAAADDALLVRDRNANGRIDSGAELFGDFTPLPDGTLAANGFAALAALDENGDGILDASDPAFASLRLWRDTVQDGESGDGELISLADAGIVSLNLASSLRNQRLANGNTLSREGSFTRSDLSTGGMGEFRLAVDTFDTLFAEAIAVPDDLRTLPNMGGAGKVRELQQAAAQSAAVADVLARFRLAATRDEQKALLDQLVAAWADTSGMAGSMEERAEGQYRIRYEAFGAERRSANLVPGSLSALPDELPGSSVLLSDLDSDRLSGRYRSLIAEWSRKLHVLEAFNGQYFFNLPGAPSETANDSAWGRAA